MPFRILVLLAIIGVILYLIFTSTFPFKDTIFNLFYPKPNSEAAGVNVNIQNGKLFINGAQFNIKGINYNPTSIGSDQIDPNAPSVDVPKIAGTGANTIGTYNLGKFEWAQWSDITVGENFYNNLYPAAEQKNLKIIVAYFSNQSINWTDASRVAKVTSQYQALVLKAKDRPSTLMYLIGNEIFEKLPDESQKVAYAKWIGEMVNWTHSNDSLHPVMYADNDQMVAMNYLKTYASNIDVYGYNNYVWSNSTELKNALVNVQNNWSGKPILLHEWGVDSFDVPSWSVNENAQYTRVKQLLEDIDTVYGDSSVSLLGSTFFEYTDDWNKLGNSSAQNPDQGWPWGCKTPFDQKCNEEYWGVATAANSGDAKSRRIKPAFNAFSEIWGIN